LQALLQGKSSQYYIFGVCGFFIKFPACSITVSNTTYYCNHTILLLVFIYICSLEWFTFSKSIEFMYLMNCFKYLLVSSLLLTGQLPTLSTLFFRVFLSLISIFHWYNRWSTVCMSCLHGHSGFPIILIGVSYYYYWYSDLGLVWAETRVQSRDWYGSGTLHPG
jgi:hypothetical protein